MSKTWYPVIDYDKCTGCLTCFNKCAHGVYALAEGKPVVVQPGGCVQGCHGCGAICPEGAIEYFGEAKAAPEDCGCGCESGKDKSCCNG